MPVLLHLDSSADLEHSRSRAITSAFAEAWAGAGAERSVVHRDLHRDALPHLPHPAAHGVPGDRDEASVPPDVAAVQQTLLDELLAADVVVVGAPMYNYSIPSTLKAWIDYVHLPGLTAGEGTTPLAGRPVVVASARGAVYDAGTPTADWDLVTPYLSLLFGEVFGMTVHHVQMNLTLAGVVPALAPFAERGAAEFTAALATARELGARL